jgi:hypothetical protein
VNSWVPGDGGGVAIVRYAGDGTSSSCVDSSCVGESCSWALAKASNASSTSISKRRWAGIWEGEGGGWEDGTMWGCDEVDVIMNILS